MTMGIAGIGTAVPLHRIAQADAATIAQRFASETAETQRLIQTMYRGSSVETRYSVVLDASEGGLDARQSFFGARDPSTRDRMQKYETDSGALALGAARAALDDAGIAPGRVTHLVTVSCTGFQAPGVDVALIRRLGLPSEVARTHVGFMGCHGALNGLRVANAYLGADPTACVLLCAVELCSLHHQYGDSLEKIVANALFSDGAGALVGVAGKSARAGAYKVVATGSTLIDDSEDAMSWRIGDHGFTMTLSPRVPELIARNLRPWLENWLAPRHGPDRSPTSVPGRSIPEARASSRR